MFADGAKYYHRPAFIVLFLRKDTVLKYKDLPQLVQFPLQILIPSENEVQLQRLTSYFNLCLLWSDHIFGCSSIDVDFKSRCN